MWSNRHRLIHKEITAFTAYLLSSPFPLKHRSITKCECVSFQTGLGVDIAIKLKGNIIIRLLVNLQLTRAQQKLTQNSLCKK